MTESERAADILERFCIGYGVDVGCGEHKVVPWAIGLDFEHRDNRADQPITAADVCGPWEEWFEGTEAQGLDFVFSSHLLEDYTDWRTVMETWFAALRNGGLIVLLLPDEEQYRKHCHEHGQVYNEGHNTSWLGPGAFIADLRDSLSERTEVVQAGVVEPYSFYVVLRRT
jgi:predicted SAM-dependent methyltransferase